MSAALPQPARAPNGPLAYPFDGAPDFGDDAREVAPGIMWLRMPLGTALTHVNLFAIADGNGWTLVDTGMKNAETLTAWPAALTGALQGRPITRVIVTHMHPDHVGMAGWLLERFGCSLWMTDAEYLTSRVLANDASAAALEASLCFYRQAGWDDEALRSYRTRFGAFGERIYALPESYVPLYDEQVLSIGRHDWHVITRRGHSPDHACLYCPDLEVFISGDQVLPRITSNVSVSPLAPQADPLAAFLATMAKLRERIPAGVLVLPAHNEPFRGLHARLDALVENHEHALARLLPALSQPRRAVDVFAALFSRPVRDDPILYMFATGESVAHLNHLIALGSVCVEHANGVNWYSLRDTESGSRGSR